VKDCGVLTQSAVELVVLRVSCQGVVAGTAGKIFDAVPGDDILAGEAADCISAAIQDRATLGVRGMAAAKVQGQAGRTSENDKVSLSAPPWTTSSPRNTLIRSLPASP